MRGATNAELLKLKADLQQVEYPVVVKNSIWKDDRHSGVEYVIVTKVKPKHITFKRNTDADDSTQLPIAAFHRKYKACSGKEGKIQVRFKDDK